eukprot:scaffold3070_cov1604-Pavlova_lutheri.AAC.4
MSERSKVSVLKTDVLQNTGGSNPSPSEPWRRVWGEARGRLSCALGGLALSASVAYCQGEALLALYLGTLPLDVPTVLFLHPTEALRTHLGLALHLALLLHLPVLLYAALCFLRPSLYRREAHRAAAWGRSLGLAWGARRRGAVSTPPRFPPRGGGPHPARGLGALPRPAPRGAVPAWAFGPPAGSIVARCGAGQCPVLPARSGPASPRHPGRGRVVGGRAVALPGGASAHRTDRSARRRIPLTDLEGVQREGQRLAHLLGREQQEGLQRGVAHLQVRRTMLQKAPVAQVGAQSLGHAGRPARIDLKQVPGAQGLPGEGLGGSVDLDPPAHHGVARFAQGQCPVAAVQQHVQAALQTSQ